MSIVIHHLSYKHPDKEILFRDLNLHIPNKQKASLTGNNGTGKSTLLRIIAGRIPPSGGKIHCTETSYYLPQQMKSYEEKNVGEVLGIGSKIKALHSILETTEAEKQL